MAGFAPQVLDEHTVAYRCDCSRERVERALVSMGREELADMAEKEGTVEVNCQFCDKKYRVDAAKLLREL